MSLCGLRKGQRVKIGASEFLIVQRIPENRWQLQNTATGEWCAFKEDDLLDRFVRCEMSFVIRVDTAPRKDRLEEKLTRDLSTYSPELLALAKSRVRYLKEIDRRQPLAITLQTIEPLIQSVSKELEDTKPPGWRTLCRNYRNWLAAGRDIRAIILRNSARGRHGTRMLPEVKAVSDQVIEELYLTAERKRVPEVHLEIVRRLG